MNGQVRPWRPVSQSDLAGVRTLAIEVFDAWFSRWIARPPTGETEAVYSAAPASTQRVDAKEWRIGNSIRITIRDGVMMRAAFLALDLPRLELAEDAEDARAVLDVLKKDMTDDFVSSFAAACGEIAFEHMETSRRPGESPSQGYALDVRQSAANIDFTLYFGEDWLTSRPMGAPVRTALPSLTSRPTALESTRIEVAAVLGRCRLTAVELTHLAVGDVITCDTHVNHPIDLSVMLAGGRTGPAIAKARPGRTGNAWSLLVSDIESQKVGNER
jgi:flagellar motor switch/type III secretory pathway protein FliN